MTGKTVTGDTAVIKPGHMPSHCSMAIITLVVTADVIHRLAGSIDIVMATATQNRRTGKAPIDMALITLDIAVFASQRKSSGKVIILCGCRQCRIDKQLAERHQKQQQPGKMA
jgi:hypothetical protein